MLEQPYPIKPSVLLVVARRATLFWPNVQQLQARMFEHAKTRCVLGEGIVRRHSSVVTFACLSRGKFKKLSHPSGHTHTHGQANVKALRGETSVWETSASTTERVLAVLKNHAEIVAVTAHLVASRKQNDSRACMLPHATPNEMQ